MSPLTSKRSGPKPKTTSTNPHTQLDQIAPRDLQERVYAFAQALTSVVVGPSHVSVPGTRAFHLPGCNHAGGFMVAHEFAHLHPPTDGSLHMTLPPTLVNTIIENGWAEPHPLAGNFGLPGYIVMVYGPRDEEELAVVEELVRLSHDFALGLDDAAKTQ